LQQKPLYLPIMMLRMQADLLTPLASALLAGLLLRVRAR
jgi:hypothetical protein